MGIYCIGMCMLPNKMFLMSSNILEVIKTNTLHNGSQSKRLNSHISMALETGKIF